MSFCIILPIFLLVQKTQ